MVRLLKELNQSELCCFCCRVEKVTPGKGRGFPEDLKRFRISAITGQSGDDRCFGLLQVAAERTDEP